MKESGIDWIGQIPEEWEVSKLEHYVDIFGRIGFRGYTTNDIVNEGEGAISYSPSNIIDYSVIDNNNTYISWSKYDESPEIQIKTGDVLYVKTGSSYGKTGIVNKLSNKATINPQLVVLKPKKNTDSRLINYFLNSSVGKEQSELIVGGSTIPTITQESIKKMIFPKISFEEQQKIADFLDKKTAQLDKVKSLLEEQIQKLRGYRASLIYETVTKGLDKTVPMKDSGIDWIGQVPEGWGISKIRYLVTTRSEKRITDSSIPYIGLENIESQTGKFVETGIQVDKSENIVVEIGDVLFGKLRPYLRKYWRATFPSTASSEFLVFQSSELDMNFLYYAIQSDSFIEEVNTSTYGSKMPRASWEYIKNMKIAFPSSLVEQQKIADFLDKKTVQIDKLIQIKNQQIDNINKQRQTLIYDYVTGKRRV